MLCGSWCRTSDKWHPVLLLGRLLGVQLQFYFRQHVENPPLVTEQGRQNWGLFLDCWDLPFFLLTFFFFFFNPKQAVKLLAPASGAGPGCSRAGIGRWSGQGRVLVVQSCLWNPAGVGLVTRTVGQEVCSFRLLVKHPQFSQQLCSSLSFGRHRNVLKMTFFVSFSPPSPFSMKAIAFWLLSIQEFVKPFQTCL